MKLKYNRANCTPQDDGIIVSRNMQRKEENISDRENRHEMSRSRKRRMDSDLHPEERNKKIRRLNSEIEVHNYDDRGFEPNRSSRRRKSPNTLRPAAPVRNGVMPMVEAVCDQFRLSDSYDQLKKDDVENFVNSEFFTQQLRSYLAEEIPEVPIMKMVKVVACIAAKWREFSNQNSVADENQHHRKKEENGSIESRRYQATKTPATGDSMRKDENEMANGRRTRRKSAERTKLKRKESSTRSQVQQLKQLADDKTKELEASHRRVEYLSSIIDGFIKDEEAFINRQLADKNFRSDIEESSSKLKESDEMPPTELEKFDDSSKYRNSRISYLERREGYVVARQILNNILRDRTNIHEMGDHNLSQKFSTFMAQCNSAAHPRGNNDELHQCLVKCN